MIEVHAKIRFNHYCLGNRRTRNTDKFLRDPNNSVMFMPTWWQALMRFAAKVLNRHHAVVSKIDWDPVIEGEPKLYRRIIARIAFNCTRLFIRAMSLALMPCCPMICLLMSFSSCSTLLADTKVLVRMGQSRSTVLLRCWMFVRAGSRGPSGSGILWMFAVAADNVRCKYMTKKARLSAKEPGWVANRIVAVGGSARELILPAAAYLVKCC